MDNREDPGQYYPGGSVVPARPEPAAHPVESVNGHAGNVVLNASDVGALPDTTAIPTADTVSGWGFLRKTWANLTAAFASITHTHTKSNITDFAHGHSQSDVTGLTTALAGKQAELVSGTNIKTVNGQSLLGSGNVVIQSGTSAHASTHAAGGADEITPASIGALASNGTAANSLKLGGIDASEYAQVGDVPTVVAPSSSAAEDAAAGAKATGEALATLSASVPSVVSPSASAAEGAAASAKATGTALAGKVSIIGDTMTGSLRVDYDESTDTGADISKEGYSIVKDGDTVFAATDGGNVLADGDVTAKGKVVVGENDYNDGTMYGNGTITRESENGETVINLPDDGQSHDFPTKTSELTNDSGFVTADAIPAPSAIANSSSKIDADGKVYESTIANDGGYLTEQDTEDVFSNCTQTTLNGKVAYKWTSQTDSTHYVTVSSSGAIDSYLASKPNSTLANKNPLAGDSYGTFSCMKTYVHTAGQSTTSWTQTDKLAREYPIKALTVTSGAATALDSTINTITPTATTTIAPPTAKTIGARDWIVVVTQGATAYGVTFSGSFVAESGFSWPTMEASKTYVFSFTEVSSNKFLAAVKEVATNV